MLALCARLCVRCLYKIIKSHSASYAWLVCCVVASCVFFFCFYCFMVQYNTNKGQTFRVPVVAKATTFNVPFRCLSLQLFLFWCVVNQKYSSFLVHLFYMMVIGGIFLATSQFGTSFLTTKKHVSVRFGLFFHVKFPLLFSLNILIYNRYS